MIKCSKYVENLNKLKAFQFLFLFFPHFSNTFSSLTFSEYYVKYYSHDFIFLWNNPWIFDTFHTMEWVMLRARSLVNRDSSENERGNKDGSLYPSPFEENEDARRRRERHRVILPLPVISDICISLSLTVLCRSGSRRKRFTCEWSHFERRKNDSVLVNKNCLRMPRSLRTPWEKLRSAEVKEGSREKPRGLWSAREAGDRRSIKIGPNKPWDLN